MRPNGADDAQLVGDLAAHGLDCRGRLLKALGLNDRPIVLLVLLALSVAARLLPYALSTFGVPIDPANTIYPWNFSPILPICLFGGAVYASRRLALSGGSPPAPGPRDRSRVPWSIT